MADPGRQAREREGRRAERLAALYLRLKRYRILGRNIETPYGEIDILARRGQILVAVEVKHRPDDTDIGKVIRPKQRERIARGAGWLMEHGRYGHDFAACRFDLILMRPGRWPHHWQDAWRP